VNKKYSAREIKSVLQAAIPSPHGGFVKAWVTVHRFKVHGLKHVSALHAELATGCKAPGFMAKINDSDLT
jgi:hypothetical protein